MLMLMKCNAIKELNTWGVTATTERNKKFAATTIPKCY
jgi:hypothetical protein